MAKGGVYRIKGDKSPLTGVKTFYNVVEWYADTPLAKRREELVTWELFVKEKNGYRSTGIKKRGINHFTFGPNAHKFSYKVEGYLHEAEGKEPMAIFVQPQKNEKAKPVEKDILGVSLTYHDGSKITKALSYRDRLKATAKCQGLEGLKIVFTLWEDDENTAGHNTKNQYITKSPEIEVDSKGYARWNFTLLNTFINLANKREDDKKQHEYYVTAEYLGKYKSSANVNFNNPEAGKATSPSKPSTSTNQPLPTTATASKPQPKPNSPKSSTNPSSKNNQSDVKGIVKSVKITDENGNPFKTNPKFGDTVRITIDAKDVKGLPYNLRVWESDYIGKNDILYNQVHTFKNDLQYVLFTLTDKMRLAGEKGNDPKNPDKGEYDMGYYQEIFAEIIFMHASSKSSNINVDLTAEQKKQVLGLSTTSVKQKPLGKIDSTCICKEKYKDLVWGEMVSCDFRKKVVEISAELWGESRKMEMADGLMAVMNVETAGSFKAHQIMGKDLKDVNKITKDDFWLTKADGTKTSRAVGLIQFTQSALQAIGEFKAGTGFDKLHTVKLKFATMGEIKQLDYVKKYFNDSRDKIKSPADIYLHVFAPNGVGKKDNYVLYVNGTEEYKQNKSVDIGSKGKDKGDGKIQRSEILERFYDSMKKGANNKPQKFICSSGTKTEFEVVTDLITIHIYPDGLMEKHTPPKIKSGFEKKYKYVYHDKSGKIHDLGIYTIIPTQVYGGKRGTNINLVDLSTIKESFKSGQLQYTFKIDSPRKYVNTRTLASLFGAMLEVGYNDISCNGFSHSDGSSRPSTSHINGNNGDFKYLRKDKKLMVGAGTSLDISANPDMFDGVRQNKWNNALFRFGWKSMLGWSYKRNGKVIYPDHITKNTKNHHHHLHVQGYDPNFKEIKK